MLKSNQSEWPEGPLVIVGASGRMSLMVQELCVQQKIPFRIFSENASAQVRTDTLIGFNGVIDFSLPQVSEEILEQAREAQIPYVCGTTGWDQPNRARECFERASRKIPIVWESNFSVGIEVLSQLSETLVKLLQDDVALLDLHHDQKRDAPSGTALKLKDRILSTRSTAKVEISSIRLGSIPGEHRILVSLPDETLELTHRASSRRPFALGALQALAWAQKQKPGLYSMSDVLSSKDS